MNNSNVMERVLFLIKIVKDNYDKLLNDISQKCGITSQEAEILLIFYNNTEFCYAKDVVVHRGYSKSYVSKAITKLVSRGYIRIICNDNDKRNKKVVINDSAYDLIIHLKAVQKSSMSFLHKNINNSELKAFFNVINKMYNNIVK